MNQSDEAERTSLTGRAAMCVPGEDASQTLWYSLVTPASWAGTYFSQPVAVRVASWVQ